MTILPAIDLRASGTRKEERLYSARDSQRLDKLRRMLAPREPKEALALLFQLLERYPTNQDLLRNIPL